ncbi:MAG: TfoX/Sxy family protein [Rubrivivax sp.]|nr:TfoX/Sxy family protein [Rubrivivax sp.]
MFGGWGLYAGDRMVALIAFERLYLKVDDSTRDAFERAGGEPFVYAGAGRTSTMSYWTVPAEAMDAPALMAPWARLALQAALRAAAAKAGTRAPAAAKAGTRAPAAAKATGVSSAPKAAGARSAANAAGVRPAARPARQGAAAAGPAATPASAGARRPRRPRRT